MASFMAQIQSLTNLTSDATTQGYVSQWLNDGAVEIINNLPDDKLSHVSTKASFTSSAVGSESEAIGTTSKILDVFRTHSSSSENINCRQIEASVKFKANDEDDILYATEYDPVYYLENNKINTLPKSGASFFNIVTYPTGLLYSTDAIATFPQEYDYLVMLYAAVKAAEWLLASEEDVEIYSPIITTLKDDYKQALAKLQGKPQGQPK